MWKKILAIIFLFFIFAFLQISFFAYFSPFGMVPNLVFVFFFVLVFFSNKPKPVTNDFFIVFLAFLGGLVLDIFSYRKLGISIALLALIGFSMRKTQSSLKVSGDNHPISYFWTLFLVYFVIYEALMDVYLYFFEPAYSVFNFNWLFIANLAYNLLFALLGFLVYKKLFINAK